MPTLEPGHVFERYRVIRWLGSGVSGESYEAEDAMLMRKVTLKLIQPQVTLPDSARRQFFRELQGTSALNHPYLAPILDYGELNGRLYIARKFLGSGSLLGTEGRLWFRPPLNEIDAIHYTHQLAQVLHYIHSRGYVHGAITFSNILLLRGPNLNNEPDYAPFLLADVGLANFARRFGQEQKSPLPITAAPEQFGKRTIPASDQFALAVLLYFWLAGRPPYLGTPEEIEQLKLGETVTPLSSLNPHMTIEQSGILLRALSAYPEDRYPSVLAFAEALLKTLPPILPVIPQTEPAQFDGHAAPSPVPTPDEREQEAVFAASPVSEEQAQALHDTDREPYVTPVLPSDGEAVAVATAPETGEPAPVTQFGVIPETDPVITFEPESATAEEPVEAVTSVEGMEDQHPVAEAVTDVDMSISGTESPTEEEPVTMPETAETEQAVSELTSEPEILQEASELTPEPEIPQEVGELAPEPESNIPSEQSINSSVAPETPELQEVEPAQMNGAEAPGNGYHPPSSEEPQESLPEINSDVAVTTQPGSANVTPTRVARLIITSPYLDGPYEVKLEGDEFTIGRAGSSTILLDQDNLTSRHHALLKCQGNRYLLFDMRSANGVFVNGQKIVVDNEYELLDGDHISIGNYELIFRSGAFSSQRDAAADQLTPAAGYEVSQLV